MTIKDGTKRKIWPTASWKRTWRTKIKWVTSNGVLGSPELRHHLFSSLFLQFDTPVTSPAGPGHLGVNAQIPSLLSMPTRNHMDITTPPLPLVPPEVLRVAEHRHTKGLMHPYIYHILTKVCAQITDCLHVILLITHTDWWVKDFLDVWRRSEVPGWFVSPTVCASVKNFFFRSFFQGEIKLLVSIEDDGNKELPSAVQLYRPIRQFVYGVLFSQAEANKKAERLAMRRNRLPECESHRSIQSTEYSSQPFYGWYIIIHIHTHRSCMSNHLSTESLLRPTCFYNMFELHMEMMQTPIRSTRAVNMSVHACS